MRFSRVVPQTPELEKFQTKFSENEKLFDFSIFKKGDLEEILDRSGGGLRKPLCY